jgi:hypothetical protein
MKTLRSLGQPHLHFSNEATNKLPKSIGSNAQIARTYGQEKHVAKKGSEAQRKKAGKKGENGLSPSPQTVRRFR